METVCRFTKRRQPIFLEDSGDFAPLYAQRFALILIRRGSLCCVLNGVQCYLSGGNLLCLSENSSLEIIQKYNISAVCLSFAPNFVNRRLRWEYIYAEGYASLCQTDHYPDFRPFLFPNRPSHSRYCGVIPLDGDMQERAEYVLAQIQSQLLTQPDKKWSCRARSWLFELLDLVQCGYQALTSAADREAPIPRVLGYIAAHLSESLPIDRLSRVSGLNRSALTAQFRAYTGTSINAYISEKRFDIVKKQLAFTNLSLKEIAAINGYSSSPYLVRICKGKTGRTPLEYRAFMQRRRQEAGKDPPQ